MKLTIINIGKSKGIKLRKTIFKPYHIGDTIELSLEKGYIILKPKSKPRKNWEKAFRRMHDNGDDKLIIDDVFEQEFF